MLASAPAGQLAMWRRHYEKNPFHWHQASMVASQIINYLKVLEARHLLNNREMKEEEFLKFDEFVPKFRAPSEKETKLEKPTFTTRMKSLKSAFKVMTRVR